jgi:hypothetical protein
MMGQGQILACYRKGGCTPEGIPVNPTPEWWGVGPNNSPQMNEQITKNSQIIWDVLSKFPYPAPFLPGEGVSFFLSQLKSDLMGLAASEYGADQDVIKCWVTLQVLANYDAWAQMMAQNAAKLQERRKKAALRVKIAVTVGSLVVGIAAPAAMAAILSVVKSYNSRIDAANAKAAAESLKEAKAVFAANDPEFAKEIDRARDMVGRFPDGAQPTTEAASNQTALIVVGGGVLAAGLAALHFLRA